MRATVATEPVKEKLVGLRSAIRSVALFLCGVALLPVCVAATMAVVSTVGAVRPSSVAAVPPSAWAFGIGFVIWVLLYFSLPRPMRIYVLGHELTHALWGWLSGSSVSRMRVSKSGGSVAVSDNNMLITLAPYFFPLYTVLVIAGYGAASLFWDVRRYELFWVALVAFTWAFHITFTISMLLERQSDVHQYGRTLSYAVIYLVNVLEAGLWIVAVSSATLEGLVRALGTDLWRICIFLKNSATLLQ